MRSRDSGRAWPSASPGSAWAQEGSGDADHRCRVCASPTHLPACRVASSAHSPPARAHPSWAGWVTAATQALQPFIRTRTQEQMTPVDTVQQDTAGLATARPATVPGPPPQAGTARAPGGRSMCGQMLASGCTGGRRPRAPESPAGRHLRGRRPQARALVWHEQGHDGVGVPVGLRGLVGHRRGALSSVRGKAKQC